MTKEYIVPVFGLEQGTVSATTVILLVTAESGLALLHVIQVQDYEVELSGFIRTKGNSSQASSVLGN